MGSGLEEISGFFLFGLGGKMASFGNLVPDGAGEGVGG
jgi:hypothetical protein